MRIKAIKKMTLLSALCGAGILIASGYGLAGNGNSGNGGNSGGNGGGSAGNSASGAGQSGASGRGGVSSSLRKLNGVVRANDIALEKASDKSIHGYARAYRDAANGLGTLADELETLNGELAALQDTRTDEDIQEDIDALKPEDFDTEELYNAAVTAYQDEMLTAPSESELAGLISAKQGEIAAKTAEIGTLEDDRDEAWENLTGGRELTEEALAVLKAKLGVE